MKHILALSLVFFVLFNFAQDYHYQSSIDKVDKEAYYKLLIAPEISAKTQKDFSDLRILDGQDTEVPYVLSREQGISEKDLFRTYEIVELEHVKNRHYTRLVIRNPEQTKIDNLVLKVKNAEVRKQLKLNASNDLERWYVLKDNYFYNSIKHSNSTSEIRVLNFPLSDYEYYEILIEDFFDKPINILEAGYYDRVMENGKYNKVSFSDYLRKDSLKTTTIAIPLQKQLVDKISFEISHPKYFLRQAQIYTKHLHKSKKRSYTSREHISNIKLVSNSSNTFLFNKIQADTLFIEIENKDDKALTIDKIECFQLNTYLTAELSPKQNYRLLFSNSKASKPQYDLKYFLDSIPMNTQIVQTGTIDPIEIIVEEATTNINIENYWLWLIIIVVVLLLAYMSYKMINDNKLKDKEQA